MAKIMIVDDDPDVVEAIRLVLEGQGHETSEAFSRADGMKAIKNNEPDLLILDVMMEEPDAGFTMAYELRDSGFAKPIILLSSISKLSGWKYGKDGSETTDYYFVDKPVKPDDLLAKVKDVLSKN